MYWPFSPSALSRRADEKKDIDKAKLVGKWKVTKGENVPAGATIEFTKDGKLSMSFDVNGTIMKVEGTYKVEGDKLHTTIKMGDKEEMDTDTLKSLTDDKLVVEDKAGKVVELEKVKK